MTTGPTPVTEPRVVLAVVVGLFFVVIIGFLGTFYLIHEKIDGSLIAVFSGLTGTALGMVGSILNNTRTNPAPPNENTSATATTTENAALTKP